MTTVYLDGKFMPMSEAKISPMDRGFLFGDGVYEVIPSHSGKPVGFLQHMARLKNNLAEIEIKVAMSDADWHLVAERLMAENGNGCLGIYIHVSRGADITRFHAYPEHIKPTIFAFAFDIPETPQPDKNTVKGYKVVSAEDMRWKRCHIKSTSLLGNVMHFQNGQERGVHETILYNRLNELTEASSCNVFIVKNEVVATPPLDNQLLPGVTRNMLIDILHKEAVLEIQERIISMAEVRSADEIWLTSSSRDVVPVVELDGKQVGNGNVGNIWQLAQALFSAHKFDY